MRVALIVATAERAAPEIVAARGRIDAFHALISKRDGDGLEAWIDAALTSPVESFAKGIAADRATVVAAIRQPWSNGQTEGQTCRLRTLKQQMGSLAIVDLLKARLMRAA